MNKILAPLALLAAFAAFSMPAWSQTPAAPAAPAEAPPMRIDGTISVAMPGHIEVTTAAGEKKAVLVGDMTRINLITGFPLSEITAGAYVGAAAAPDANGKLTALYITIFPEERRGAGEGVRPWEGGPNNTMTNAGISQVVGTTDRTITQTFPGGESVIYVPEGTPIIRNAPGDASILTVGAHVVVRATAAADGTLTATGINVGKDGFTPPR